MAKKSSEDPRRLELHLSYACVQLCAFCSESGRMARFAGQPVGLKEVLSVLLRKRRAGCSHVTFTGGEPTLRPDLPVILATARRLGYSTYLTSNGCRLAEPAYARRVLPLLDELCLSVHGGSARVHDRATRTPGGFAKLRAALRNVEAAARPPFLLTNTVLTRENLPGLNGTLEFILRHRRVRHVLLSNLAPEGRGGEGYARLAVRLGEFRRRIPAAAKRVEGRGVVFRVFGVPACVLGGRWDCSNDLYWSPRVTVERGAARGRMGLRSIVSLRPDRLRVHTPRCRGCALRRRCPGLFEAQLRLYGDCDLAAM
ncbi:MAG: hypothetical protein A2X36_10765 [Elusimicrobia bacterium GWA2_69_24]|nr:MAG: hypothetical protein A2X36_10765 [Elusimicrobia bacterium GWA2_69_24]